MSPELNAKLNPKLNPKRRHLLYAGLAAGFGAAGLWWLWPEQGIANPCRAALPPHLADHEVVRAAWSGIDAAKVWDCHAHLAGSGDSGSGIWFNPEMESPLHPLQYAQLPPLLRAFFFRSA
jgi:uncharacterized protein